MPKAIIDSPWPNGPTFPWACPSCGEVCETAEGASAFGIVATFEREKPEEATFLCLACDFGKAMGLQPLPRRVVLP